MKIFLIYCLFCFSVVSYAQKTKNKLSLELNLGSTNPFTNLTKKYYANFVGFLHYDLGGRYMFAEKLGVKLDIGMDRLKNDAFGTYNESLPFHSLFYRVDLQMIANIGKVLHFYEWTKRIGVLAHTGIGYSVVYGDSSKINAGNKMSDRMLNFMFGFTPQFKLTPQIVLNLDLSLVCNLNPSYNFDFKDISTSRYGMIANVSVGLTYYFGRYKTHYDWDLHTSNDDFQFDKQELLVIY